MAIGAAGSNRRVGGRFGVVATGLLPVAEAPLRAARAGLSCRWPLARCIRGQAERAAQRD